MTAVISAEKSEKGTGIVSPDSNRDTPIVRMADLATISYVRSAASGRQADVPD